MRPTPSCLFGFICRCLHFNVEHDDLVGQCRAQLVSGTRCGCTQFAHDHDEICTPPEPG
jgi:hypothetical protein